LLKRHVSLPVDVSDSTRQVSAVER